MKAELTHSQARTLGRIIIALQSPFALSGLDDLQKRVERVMRRYPKLRRKLQPKTPERRIA